MNRIGILALACASICTASSITTQATAELDLETWGIVERCCPILESYTHTKTDPFQAMVGGAVLRASGSAMASAYAADGRVSTLVSVSGSGGDQTPFFDPLYPDIELRAFFWGAASASAQIDDSWRLYGRQGAGILLVESYLHADGISGGGSIASFTVGQQQTTASGEYISQSQIFIVPFTWGESINFSASTSAYASEAATQGGAPSAYAAVSIDSIKVLDSEGKQIHRYAYRSDLGHSYNFVDGLMAPEPNTMSLTAAAAAFAAVLHWRRRQHTLTAMRASR